MTISTKIVKPRLTRHVIDCLVSRLVSLVGVTEAEAILSAYQDRIDGWTKRADRIQESKKLTVVSLSEIDGG